MKNLDVLLLGWEFPPLSDDDSGEACYALAKEMASQVNLSLILPKADPDYVLTNVDLTGLNNIDLQATQKPVTTPAAFSTFAPTNEAPSEIPLYGAPTYTTQENVFVPAVELPGEAASAGELGDVNASSTSDNSVGLVEELNIFGQTDLRAVDYNTQVIQFARYATRLASQKSFDVIYAYDWMTYLAGIELKLISGKLLVVHVQSLSDGRGGPDHKGWVYEVEKQALEKADFIIAQTDKLAEQVVAEYGISEGKIRSINNLDEPLPFEIMEAAEESDAETTTAEAPSSITGINTDIIAPASAPEPLRWEDAAANIVTIFQKLLEAPRAVAK